MGYVVLARKYRPQTFDEFVGQTPIATTLRNAITSGRVAHAYLFCGPRGIGKTSMARVFAKALNCTKGPTPKPCNRCDICQRVAVGDDVDVIEIDGASNRGIEEVREIRQNVQYAASRSRFKIYIIDEVHMLTGPAFNALLKTLEEPPSHVKFIFATTAPTRLPETIHSRCQRFDFRRIPPRAIADALGKICRKEKVTASKEALLAVGRHGRGSMRDALSLLDQLIAFGDGAVGLEDVHTVVGAASAEAIDRLLDSVAGRDPGGALRVANELLAEGKDVGDLLAQLASHLRDLLVAAYCGPEPELVHQTADGAAKLVERAKLFSTESLLYMIQVLAEARRQARDSSQERVVLEMVLVKLCRMEEMTTLDELSRRLADLQTNGASRSGRDNRGPEPQRYSEGPAEAESASARVCDPPAAPAAPHEGSAKDIWAQVVAAIRQERMQLGLQLMKWHLGEVREDEVAIAGGDSRVLASELADPENRQLVETALAEALGREVKLRVVASAEPAPGRKPRRAKNPRAESAASRDPMVRKVLDVFGGRIVGEETG